MNLEVTVDGKVVNIVSIESTEAYRCKQEKLLEETGAVGVPLSRHHNGINKMVECTGTGKLPSDVNLGLAGAGVKCRVLDDSGEIEVTDVGMGLLETTCVDCGGRFYFSESDRCWYRM
jgi:hypothetical protein